MAFTVAYRCEFTDTLGVDWKVDLEKDQAQAAIVTMTPTGNPLNIEWLTPGDELTMNAIKGSIATLEIECDTNFQYIGLYSSAEMVYKMKVYYGATLYWQGWLNSDYTEPYSAVPYTVSLVAADGLGLLKGMEYLNGTAHYTGWDEEGDVVLALLARIGHTSFTEYCNIYEDRMADAVGDSPFTQAIIDRTLFDEMDCYSVLDAIVRKYNAVIRQHMGGFVIYRPAELVADTVYGRIIATGSVTATSITPDQFIFREGVNTSDLQDLNGGVLMMQPPISKFTAEQNYGYRQSWLDNHLFDSDTFNLTTGEFEGWTVIGGRNSSPLPGHLAGETDGIIMTPAATCPDPANYVYQMFGNAAKATSDIMMFSMDYRLINWTGALVANVDVCISISHAANDHWVDLGADDIVTTWETTEHFLNWTVDPVPTKLEGWVNFSVTIPGLPSAGPYKIKLFSSHKGIFIAYRDIRFYSSADQVVVKKWRRAHFTWNKNNWPKSSPLGFRFGRHSTREYIDNEEVVSKDYVATNAIAGMEASQSYILGDCEDTAINNVVEQYAGAISMLITGSLAQTATDFALGNATTYAAGGVVVTSSNEDVIFTAAVAGTNFTGNTTITNATGTLSGSVAATQANAAATGQVARITLTGVSGTAKIFVGGLNKKMLTFATDLNTTASNFVGANAVFYAAANVTVTFDNDDLIFTETTPGGGFGAVTIDNSTLTLDGFLTIGGQTDAAAAQARIDTVTLTGTTGTANILCDGTTRTATFNTGTTLEHTVSWHTRGNTESLPVIELIADEIADMYSKGRHFLQLSLMEVEGNPTNYYPTYNLQDPLNVTGADNKLFVTNRAALDVRNREWTADLIEINVK